MNYRILAALLLVLMVGVGVCVADEILDMTIPIETPVFDNATGVIYSASWENWIFPKINGSQPVQFFALAYNASKWNWSFGDGYNSSEETPYHTYTKSGCYDVSLIAQNSKHLVKRKIIQHICTRIP